MLRRARKRPPQKPTALIPTSRSKLQKCHRPEHALSSRETLKKDLDHVKELRSKLLS